MKRYKLLSAVVGAFAFFACESEEFLEFDKANSVITSSEYPAYTAAFTTIDEVIVPVQAANANSVEVTALLDGTLTNYSQSFSGGEFTIQDTWAAIAGATATELGGDAVTLRVTAEANGESSFRDFDLSYSNPISLTAEGTALTDSLFQIKVDAETMNAAISTINFYYMAPGDTVFATTPFQSLNVGAVSVLDSIQVAFPGEDSIDFGGSVSYRVEAVAASGLSDQVDIEVEAVEVPFVNSGEVVLFADDFVITPSTPDDPETPEDEFVPAVLDLDNSGYDFSAESKINDSIPADMKLVVDGTDLVLELGAGVEYIFDTTGVAGYQSARDKFNAATMVQTDEIVDLANILSTNNLSIILSIPDLANANTGSGEFVVIRVTEVNKNTEAVDPTIPAVNNSTIRFTYEGYFY